LGDVLVESEVDDTWLDCGPSVFDVQRHDLLQSMEPDDDDIIGERSAGESGACAPGDEGDLFVGEKSNH
jgi:hypothetical protein